MMRKRAIAAPRRSPRRRAGAEREGFALADAPVELDRLHRETGAGDRDLAERLDAGEPGRKALRLRRAVADPDEDPVPAHPVFGAAPEGEAPRIPGIAGHPGRSP